MVGTQHSCTLHSLGRPTTALVTAALAASDPKNQTSNLVLFCFGQKLKVAAAARHE